LTIGHHGIFSLTPIWLLAVPGLFWLWRGQGYRMGALAGLIAAPAVICLTFYILRPQVERNYGGTAHGFPWIVWVSPLWLMAMLPTADKLSGSRVGRSLGYFLLAVSVLSVTYPVWNPWTFPWLTNLFVYEGWSSF